MKNVIIQYSNLNCIRVQSTNIALYCIITIQLILIYVTQLSDVFGGNSCICRDVEHSENLKAQVVLTQIYKNKANEIKSFIVFFSLQNLKTQKATTMRYAVIMHDHQPITLQFYLLIRITYLYYKRPQWIASEVRKQNP